MGDGRGQTLRLRVIEVREEHAMENCLVVTFGSGINQREIPIWGRYEDSNPACLRNVHLNKPPREF